MEEEKEIRRLPEEGGKVQKKIRKSRFESMGVIDEEIRNAMEVEIRRLAEEEEVENKKRSMGVMDEEIRNAMKVEINRLTGEDEAQTNKYLMDMEVEQIRNTRFKSVLHISPLEIIDNPGDQDFINVVAENISQIELVIIVIDHFRIHQYWTPRSATNSSSSSSSSSFLCQHHDYLHPRDDDDEEMILATCRPLLDTPQRIKIIIDQGVFAAASDDENIMSTLLRNVDVLFEYSSILPTYEHLEDLKRSITRRISEAKEHVLRVKPFPKRVRICVEVSQVQKQYYGSAEDATLDAVINAAYEASACAYYE